MPKVKPRQRVLAPSLPPSLSPPDRPEVQYPMVQHTAGKRRGEKRRLGVEEPEPVQIKVAEPKASSSVSGASIRAIQPRPSSSQAVPLGASGAPILLVVPSQAPSITLQQPSTSQGSSSFIFQTPPPAPQLKSICPNKSLNPCAACQVPKCGGLRKKYTPSKDKVTSGSQQKIFTFCPTTRKSTTPGFEGVFDDYEHFKKVVDEELLRRKNNDK